MDVLLVFSAVKTGYRRTAKGAQFMWIQGDTTLVFVRDLVCVGYHSRSHRYSTRLVGVGRADTNTTGELAPPLQTDSLV